MKCEMNMQNNFDTITSLLLKTSSSSNESKISKQIKQNNNNKNKNKNKNKTNQILCTYVPLLVEMEILCYLFTKTVELILPAFSRKHLIEIE